MEAYSRKADEKMDNFDRKNGKLLEENRRKYGYIPADNHRYSRNTAPRDELNHCANEGRYKQISERITNIEKKTLDMEEHTKTGMKNPCN